MISSKIVAGVAFRDFDVFVCGLFCQTVFSSFFGFVFVGRLTA